MEQTVYFYSTDGTDSHGPVTRDELCQLIIAKVIGADSFYCHDGETEWRPLDPDHFVRPPGTTRLPPYEPPPYVPPPDARQRDEERVAQLQQGWDDPGPYPATLTLINWMLAIAGTVIVQKLRHGADGIVGYIGAFIVVGVLPYLISRPFKLHWRLRVCFVSMIVLSALAIVGQVKLNSATADADPNAPATPSGNASAAPAPAGP